MNTKDQITLWTTQITTAAFFGMAGTMTTFTPIGELGTLMPWAPDAPVLTRIAGIALLLGAAGLVLPMLSSIRPQVIVLSAVLLSLAMLGAMVFHAVRGEYLMIPVNLVLLSALLFIAWGWARITGLAPAMIVAPAKH
ncbi:MAG TPA: DoxX family protein [Flavobacteriales bacterium]|nr:DoxX family protein [Flavobacteriales bacterium]